MGKYAYGQQPSDLRATALGLGWLQGVRHLKSASATGSYWHVHREIQFLFCIRGEFTYEFRDRPPVVLSAGHFIVIPPSVEHRHIMAIDPAGHRVELLLTPPGCGRRAAFRAFPVAMQDELIEGLLSRASRSVPCDRPLQALFAELDALAVKGPDCSARDLALARTLATGILLRCTARESLPPPPSESERLMDQALAWLEGHFAENVSVDRLVSITGFSRTQTFTLFKSRTGLSPADWLTRRRIREAQRLLEGTDRAVSEISADCGFSSPDYFSTVFKKQTGLRPLDWRRGRTAGEAC